jgi:hypothetical protein
MPIRSWTFRFASLGLCAAGATLAGCNSTTDAAKKAEEAAENVVEAAAPKASALTLKAGSLVLVRTTSTLSTQSNAAGSTFTATLEAPLMDGDRVIAPRGAEVEGLVAHSDKGGRVKGRASMALQLTRVHPTNNRVIPIATALLWRSAPGSKKRDAVTVGALSGAGAAIGAIAGGGRGAAIGAGAGAGAGAGTVLATRGKPAVVPAESVLTFRLRDEVRVEQ